VVPSKGATTLLQRSLAANMYSGPEVGLRTNALPIKWKCALAGYKSR